MTAQPPIAPDAVPLDADERQAARFYSSRVFGQSFDQEALRLIKMRMEEQVDPLVFLFREHRLAALRAPGDGAAERMREAVDLVRDMLPYLEPARLREQADAIERKIDRMPVRSIVQSANNFLAALPATEPGEK